MTDLLEVARLNSATGLGKLLGLVFDEAEVGRLVGHLDIDDRHLQPFGLVNGGVWCTVVETFGSVGGVLSVIDDGKVVVGVSNRTDFIRPVRSGRVEIEATPIHVGRSQHLWRVVITREDGALVAQGQVRLQIMDAPADAGDPPKES